MYIYYFRELVQFGSPDESTAAAVILITLLHVSREVSLNFYCIIWNTKHECIFLLQSFCMAGFVIVIIIHDVDQIVMFLSPM